MPWKVTNPVNERMRFVSRLLDGERMTDVCRQFGISRKTGYKIWRRFEKDGMDAFRDRSRRPLCVPHETPRGIVAQIVELREKHPTWGPKKLKERLATLHPEMVVPAKSTIGAILNREGLIKKRMRRRRATPTPTPLVPGQAPNDLWAMDFKGEFRVGCGTYCYPLTISDDCSRFLLDCHALTSTRGKGTQEALIEVFRQYGLPQRLRSDNGAPFASTGRLGVTQLSVWLLRLGVTLERIEPGHPEQNGRHERMHKTLKADCPRANGILQQQENFDAFRNVYNHERPHEALEMKTPADVYTPASRQFPEQLPPLNYPNHELVRRVYSNGHALLPGRHDKDFYVGTAFNQQYIGLNPITEDTWSVAFMQWELGLLDLKTGKLLDMADTAQP